MLSHTSFSTGLARGAIAAAFVLGFGTTCQAYAAGSSRSCTAAEKKEADRWLWLSPADKLFSVQTNLPWGAPINNDHVDDEVLLIQRDYVNSYDKTLRIPLWSAERLDPKRFGKVPVRINCFRRDPRLQAEAASAPSDYVEPIYDQGHLSPDADQDSSVTAALNTYVMSNMAPENCQFNRGIWQILEGLTRRWAKERGTAYVLSGSVFDRDGDGRRDPDDQAVKMASKNGKTRVAVPSAMYKIVALLKTDGSVETLTVLLPHDTSNPNGDEAVAYLQAHIVTIAKVEALTGLDLFPNAAALQESTELWPFVGKPPRSLCSK
jgi:DNA/RNA endonuclease G (NUC1)